MGDLVKVARKDELAPGTGKTVDVAGTPVALFNVGGTYYALHNTCRHRGGPLGEGELSNSVVGSGGGRQAAERLGLSFLGEIPLATGIRAAADEGHPTVISDPDSSQAKAFLRVAENLAAQISIRGVKGELAQEIRISF